MTNFNYNSIPEGYYDKIFKLKKGVQSAWHHVKFDFVFNKIKESEIHLDVGCGPGTFIGNYMKNSNAFGVDISKDQINYANKTYKNRKFILLNEKKFPFRDKTFDSISLIEIIEHLEKEEVNNLLNECKRCLKDSGKIILTTPNYISFWPILELVLNKISKVNYEHQHITKFNLFSLKKIILKHGFKSFQLGTFITISPFVAFVNFKFSKILSKFDLLDTKVGFLLYGILKK